MLGTYNRYPIVLTRGKGVFLCDLDDQRYLDFVRGWGVNALGHAHPRIVKTIREQAAEADSRLQPVLPRVSGSASGLCTLAGGSSSTDFARTGSAKSTFRAFFQNSGTEAIEGSIKLARLAGHRTGDDGKSRLVALQGSYHGRTFGALSLTGQEKHRKEV